MTYIRRSNLADLRKQINEALEGLGEGVWATNGNDIYNTNLGNVGINTDSPLAPLHLNVTGGEADGLLLGDIELFPFNNTGGYGHPTFMNADDTKDVILRVIPNTGQAAQFEFFNTNYYADTVNWSNWKVVSGTSVVQVKTGQAGTAALPAMEILTGGNDNQLFLNTDGNVGINTATPGAKLEIYAANNDGLRIQNENSANYAGELVTSFTTDKFTVRAFDPTGGGAQGQIRFTSFGNSIAFDTGSLTQALLIDNGTGNVIAQNDIVAGNGSTRPTRIGEKGIQLESQNHCISVNDGFGNFNIQVGNNPIANSNQNCTEAGWMMHEVFSQSNGDWRLRISDQSHAVGETPTWHDQINVTATTVTLRHSGTTKFQTVSGGVSVTGDCAANTFNSKGISDTNVSSDIVARDSNGDSRFRLIRTEYAVENTAPNINYFYTARATGGGGVDNYNRPATAEEAGLAIRNAGVACSPGVLTYTADMSSNILSTGDASFTASTAGASGALRLHDTDHFGNTVQGFIDAWEAEASTSYNIVVARADEPWNCIVYSVSSSSQGTNGVIFNVSVVIDNASFSDGDIVLVRFDNIT